MNQFREIMNTALSAGAITNENTHAGMALAALADVDPDAARKFSGQARTPIERVELHLRMSGTSLRVAREMTAKMSGLKDEAVDTALISAYGA